MQAELNVATDRSVTCGSVIERWRINSMLERINSLENRVMQESDGRIRERFQSMRSVSVRDDTDALTDSFAMVREACRRSIGLRPYDVQMLAGLVMVRGYIAEMATGEGKTLVAAMPAGVLALSGKGVHVATVNAYLAGRDQALMSPVYGFLGLSSALLPEKAPSTSKRKAYEADITYGTGYEFGFDYLRDQLAGIGVQKPGLGDAWRDAILEGNSRQSTVQAQRPFAHAIVDEMDSVLIDEAVTPMIISAASPDAENPAAPVFREAAKTASGMTSGEDFQIVTEENRLGLTRTGLERLYADIPVSLRPLMRRAWHEYVEQALCAFWLYKRDVHYLVRNGAIEIIDENTGRSFTDRKWRNGLHQAVEAKEGVMATYEAVSDVTISRQRFYKLYPFICGMTGTAKEETHEFSSVYGLKVAGIPRHKPLRRVDMPARVFSTRAAMFAAIVEEVRQMHDSGRPVLVGTRSVKQSEELGGFLDKTGIPYVLLNARQNAQEADTISMAGQKGRVTIATNMAGRGADIPLAAGVADIGGLHVIGVEYNDSRRINRQLEGRGGRQGDPGSSRFFVSCEDELVCSGADKAGAAEERELPFSRIRDFESALIERERLGALRRLAVMRNDKRMDQLKEYL